MTFNEYQEKAKRTYTSDASWKDSLILASLGLAGETGEVLEKLKKVIRDKDYEFSDQEKQEIKKEMGDVLWYLSLLAEVLQLNMNDVAQGNLDKIEDRYRRGVIAGTGDNR